MILQLNPPIPLDTPKGKSHGLRSHIIIDPGQEHYLQFVCFLDDTGECWIFQNRDVKLRSNQTMKIREEK